MIVDTSIWSSQRRNRIETLRIKRKCVSNRGIEETTHADSEGGKKSFKTFTDKEIPEYSFKITVIWFIIKPKRAAVMEVRCEF